MHLKMLHLNLISWILCTVTRLKNPTSVHFLQMQNIKETLMLHHWFCFRNIALGKFESGRQHNTVQFCDKQ